MNVHVFMVVAFLATVAKCKLVFWLECEEKGFNQVDQLLQIARNEVSKSCDKYSNCNGNGKCVTGGYCLCNEGFAGVDCGNTVTIAKGDDFSIEIDENSYGPVEDWLKEQGVLSVAVAWPTRSGINKEEALEHCRNVWIDSPYNEICSKYATKFTYKNFIDTCLNMIKVTSQMNFAYVTRDANVYECMKDIVEATKKECEGV